MNQLSFKEPTLAEYWYEAKLLSDPDTMSYNAGWEVAYSGYDYETGCIDFPKSEWQKKYQRRHEDNSYFAYIVRTSDQQFIGMVNFQENQGKYECGIILERQYRGMGYGKEALHLLCEIAFYKKGVSSLYDSFEEDRGGLSTFLAVGFSPVRYFSGKRFGKEIKMIEVCCKRDTFIK